MTEIATALQGAVARQEITAWFQPQLSLDAGVIVAAEALCRWTHPVLGSVPPGVFIPVAEETGLIEEIGQFMLEESCRAALEWSQLPTPIEVSVNVSPAQLSTPRFTDELAVELQRLSLVPQALTIEITESLPIDDVPVVVQRLDELRMLGLGVAIDDFGTGHSSLSQLRRLHATELKIDRSLVIDSSAEVARMLREVIDEVHAAGLRVVAEGVETAAQLEHVRALQCDRAQGYLISRPVPKRAIDLLLAA